MNFSGQSGNNVAENFLLGRNLLPVDFRLIKLVLQNNLQFHLGWVLESFPSKIPAERRAS